MNPPPTTLSRLAAVIGALVGLLAIVAAGAGVFLRGDLATLAFTTVRGEVVDTVSSGLYRFDGLTVAVAPIAVFAATAAAAAAIGWRVYGSIRPGHDVSQALLGQPRRAGAEG